MTSCLATTPRSVNRAGIAQRRFLAKQTGGKKKKGGTPTPKKGPAAIKARGAIPAPKAAGKHGSAGASAGAAAGAAGAKPPPTATPAGSSSGGGMGVGAGGGGGFTKSEMLAARKARKASLNEKNAAAAAAAAAVKAAEGAAPAAAPAAAGAKGSAAGAAGGKGKWGWGSKFLAGTTAGLAVLGIAWQLKPDEVRKLLDDSPIDHFAIWLVGKYALVSFFFWGGGVPKKCLAALLFLRVRQYVKLLTFAGVVFGMQGLEWTEGI